MKRGFTLVELLVVISIIGILVGLSMFGLIGAREASRDAKRKANIEEIRSGIEIYKSDCNSYPVILTDPLVGDDSTTACVSTNIYISTLPQDPTPAIADYYYFSDGKTYQICAALEQVPAILATCSGSCGTVACNYKAINP